MPFGGAILFSFSTLTAIALPPKLRFFPYNTSPSVLHGAKQGRYTKRDSDRKAMSGDQLVAGRRRHQALGLQEFYHQLVETARIFDAAGVPGLGEYLVDGSGDQ